MNLFGKAAIFLIEAVSTSSAGSCCRSDCSPTSSPATCFCCSWAAAWQSCSVSLPGVLVYPGWLLPSYVFEVGIVATPQAFIFSILTNYLHRRSKRRRKSLTKKESQ